MPLFANTHAYTADDLKALHDYHEKRCADLANAQKEVAAAEADITATEASIREVNDKLMRETKARRAANAAPAAPAKTLP